MTYVMRCWGFANGAPCPFVGWYLLSCDFEAHGGRAEVNCTPQITKAMTFETVHAAVQFYQTSPRCKPMREDGRPNRPLSCMHVEFISLDIGPRADYGQDAPSHPNK